MRRGERGVALITVILILLVLTVMGIAAALLMTQEDRTSARQEMYKAALYAAEVGLRNGEDILRNTPVNSASALLLYNPAATGAIREIWRDSTADELPRHPPCGDVRNWNAANLGTYLVRGGATPGPVANVRVPIAVASASVPTGKMAFYSLYVRNNPEDLAVCAGGGGDNDQIVRLISVGWISNLDGQAMAVKIVEEEFNYAGVSQAPSSQLQVNQGGTGQGIL